jgi:glycine cleavage system regulatory protein
MTHMFIVSFIGDAVPADIHKLAAITHENGGQWITSKINYLENRVAALIKVSAPEETEKYIKEAFISQTNLSTIITDCEIDSAERNTEYKLRIDANDRAGIVNEITHLLDSQRIRVLDMNCQRIFISDKDGVNSSLFTAHISLRLPETLLITDVINELESLSEDTKVMIDQA